MSSPYDTPSEDEFDNLEEPRNYCQCCGLTFDEPFAG